MNTDLTPDQLRDVLGGFATGVVVATCGNAGNDACGVTVNSFTSVSLEPPLVLFCLDKSAFHASRFLAAESFALNILSVTQSDLSNRFAQEAIDNLGDLETTTLDTGCPTFPNALAALDCERERVIEAGDHHILIGKVVAIQSPAEVDPLVYFKGNYAAITR